MKQGKANTETVGGLKIRSVITLNMKRLTSPTIRQVLLD